MATMVSVSQSWRGPSVAWCRCGRGYEGDFCQDKGNETKASSVLAEDIHLESKDSESAEPSVRDTAPTKEPFSRENQQSGSLPEIPLSQRNNSILNDSQSEVLDSTRDGFLAGNVM